MPQNYEQYTEDVCEDIESCLGELQCQPILFVGAGFSRRYFNAPGWDDLLRKLADDCSEIKRPFEYYKQRYSDPIDIGEKFAQAYMEWAWGDGHAQFPNELFESNQHQDIYIKHAVCKYLQSITPKAKSHTARPLRGELTALQQIQPHAIITTNYDTLLEAVFPKYEAIIGEKVLRASFASIGEILKIHGCVTHPKSLVLTRTDYDEFIKKRKYLSAKLLAFFAEHPLLFIGYSASDPNITHILSDIDLLLSSTNELIPNIYILEWKSDLNERKYPLRERVIPVNEDRSVRIKGIAANSFEWVFKAFASNEALQKVDVRLLRALMSRTYEIIRHDIPKKTIEVDYNTLEHAVGNSDNLVKLLGIQTTPNATTLNADFPYTLSQVGERLGDGYWHKAHRQIKEIEAEFGVNVKASDNRYHLAIKIGKSILHKYSDDFVDLLRKRRNREDTEFRP